MDMADAMAVEFEFADAKAGLAAADAAARRKDTDTALRIWTRLRADFPGESQAFLRPAAVLAGLRRFDEADALLAEGQRLFPQDLRLFADYAGLASQRRNWGAAARRWEQVRLLFPDFPLAYISGATALRQAGQTNAADALLLQAVERFPDDQSVAIEHASLIGRGADAEAAVRAWEQVRARFPQQRAGYLGGVTALRRVKRHDEAETLSAEAVARFPDDRAIASEHARNAQLRRDWPEASRRWTDFAVRFPEIVAGYAGAATALRETGQLDEAETVLGRAIERFPNDLDILTQRATVAQLRRDWEEAARRWKAVRGAVPRQMPGYLQGATVLREAHRIDEADTLLREAMLRFPSQPAVLVAYADNASARQDWPLAVERLTAALAQFPQDRTLQGRLAQAHRQAPQPEAGAVVPPAAGAAPPPLTDAEVAATPAATTPVSQPAAIEPPVAHAAAPAAPAAAPPATPTRAWEELRAAPPPTPTRPPPRRGFWARLFGGG
jgi:tetratricopeptide (TPR) repeat protein